VAKRFDRFDRIAVTRWTLGLGMGAGILLSWKLWVTERAFPHLPCFAWFGPCPAPWDKVWVVAFLVLLGVFLMRPDWRKVLGVALLLAVVMALQDQVRWQPWFYLYLLGLLGFVFPIHDRTEESAQLGLLRIVLVGMYFWSGWHKLGPAFENMFPLAFVEPLREKWGDGLVGALAFTRVWIPWIEMLVALLLLVPLPRWRKAGVIGAVSTHVFILVLIGPFGMNNNVVVWPWNVAMAVLVVTAFWGVPEFGFMAMRMTRRGFVAVPLALLVWLMPAFSPGRWDRYLSFHLYSGTEQRLMLVVDEQAAAVLPGEVQAHLAPAASPGLQELRLKQWALQELRVPFPGEERMNLRVGKMFADLPFPGGSVAFFYYDYEFQLRERGWDRFTPGEMLQLRELGEPKRKLRQVPPP
jgi:hypothetical protein